jgi:hypothetical protein
MPAWRVGLLIVAGLLLAALLNADALLRRAEQKPFGGERDFWVAVWRPFADASSALRLDKPREWLDDARGVDGARSAQFPYAAVPSATATATANATVGGTSRSPLDGSSVAAPPDTHEAPGVVQGPVEPKPALRTPTTTWPLRVWVGGDSLSVRLGESLGRDAADTGVMSVHMDSHIGTGLARPDVFDWTHEIADTNADWSPDVAVVIFGGNDMQPLKTADGQVASPQTDAWRMEYARRVGATMDEMAADGRVVVWVGLPIPRDASMSAKLQEIDQIERAEAGKRPGVVFIDAWKLFSDGGGGYSAYLPDGSGAMQLVREPDGLHVTRAGGDRLADAVMGAIAAKIAGP